MPKVNVKEIRERVTKMNDGWAGGAPTVEFGGIKQSDFAADIQTAANAEQDLADMDAQREIKRTEVESLYINLNAKSVLVVAGVRGDVRYGPVSPLYGAMGFVRTSDRASGLMRKTKNPEGK